MSGYMSNVDKQSYDARSRLDSGIGMVDGGYVDMLHMVSTPSTGTGTTSKSSTRSEIDKWLKKLKIKGLFRGAVNSFS